MHYNAVTPDEFRAFGFPGADELGNMWQFKRDFEVAFRARRDLSARARAAPGHGEFRHLAQGEPGPHPGGAGRLTLVLREILNWLLKLTLVAVCLPAVVRAEDARGLPQHLGDTGLYVAGSLCR